MSAEKTIRDALTLLDGRAVDEMEAHEAWLNGLEALDRLLQRLERVKEALQAARLYVNQLSDQRPTSGRVAAQRKFVEARKFVAAMYEVLEEERLGAP